MKRRTGRSTCCDKCACNAGHGRCEVGDFLAWTCGQHPDSCRGRIAGERCRVCQDYKPKDAKP